MYSIHNNNNNDINKNKQYCEKIHGKHSPQLHSHPYIGEEAEIFFLLEKISVYKVKISTKLNCLLKKCMKISTTYVEGNTFDNTCNYNEYVL